jgi:hypothetical protein
VKKLIELTLELPPLRLGFAGQPDKRRSSAVVATAGTEAALRVFEIGALFS